MGRHRAPRPTTRRVATLAGIAAGALALGTAPAWAGDAGHGPVSRCNGTAPALVAVPVCVDVAPVTTAPVTVPDLSGVTAAVADLL